MYIDNPFYNHRYSVRFSLANDVLYGINLHQVMTSTLTSGSVAGFFSENFVAEVLSKVADKAPANTRGHDLVSKSKKRPIEVKAMSQYGVKLCQSNNVGAGRKIDRNAFNADAPTKDFIVVDTTRITDGELDFVILEGSRVAESGPTLTFKKAKANFFETGEPIEITNW